MSLIRGLSLIADRFEIDRLAGAGGMGIVYRAVDRHTGQPVAVKMMARLDPGSTERFEREARILAELNHPRIVRYVAHGRTAAGQYIAMEWLDGETLADRLLRGRLEIGEATQLLETVANALAVVHGRGMVHRDIKPSNIFLAGKSIAGLKILDFGIARAGLFLSGSGVVGTPGYVAPEQAQGTRGVDARADVFALGVVMFECLTGRPAFVAGNVMALLAKILLEEAPRVRELRGDVPEALDAFVAQLLAKDPALRPRDAAQVAVELRRIGEASAPPLSPVPTALTAGEQRLLSVILATLARPDLEARARARPQPQPGNPATQALGVEGPTPGWDDATPPAAARDGWGGTRPIVDDWNGSVGAEAPPAHASTPWAGTQGPDADDPRAPLRVTAELYGGNFEELADGSLVITLRGSGAATDQAARAARCALALRALLPEIPMALATGRGMLALRFPVGEAIENAAGLLRDVLDAGGPVGPRPVRIDDTTAGLLDGRFEIGGDRRGLELIGEREGEDAARTLLGKKSPFIGRERESGFLSGLYDECVAEPMARPVLVSAPAGAGKSRLAVEFKARLARHAHPPEVWIARGDPTRAGSPFGVLAPCIRRVAGIFDGEPVAVRRQKLRARIARHVAPRDVARVSEFLGELVGAGGASGGDDESPQLRGARRDPMLLGEQMRRAWEDWILAETAAGPVALFVEDLHWGDLPTVKLIDGALRLAEDRPFFVLAFARPEVHGMFPHIWAERGLQELRLGELTRKASERLVREVLGELPEETVTRLVERAGGNALYLEELIRATSEKKSELPATVIAMMAARLEELEPEARRVLRAASIFGPVFWRSGAGALLGGDPREVREWLGVLTEREVVLRRPERRFPGEEEFVFRHVLMREAAYALLTDADRTLGHRLAADWLLRRGEPDQVTLAEHLEKGGACDKAIAHYQRAAEQALGGNDFAAAVARAQRGLRCGASGTLQADLLVVLADARNWLGEFALAEEAAAEAMGLAVRGGATWCHALGQLAIAAARRGNVERLVVVVDDVLALLAAPPAVAAARDPIIGSAARISTHLVFGGRLDLGDKLARAIAALPPTTDPTVRGMVLGATAALAIYRGDAETCYADSRAAAASFAEGGSARMSSVQMANAAYACLSGGAFPEAEEILLEALAVAQRLGLPNVIASARHNLGQALYRQGETSAAIVELKQAVEALAVQGDRRLEGSARTYLAQALLASGDIASAEMEGVRAVELLLVAPPLRAAALATLAEIRLAGGQVAPARAAVCEAVTMLATSDIEEGESLVRLMDVLTLEKLGSTAEARAALAIAATRLVARADVLGKSWRGKFLAIAENERTLALAAARTAWEPRASSP